MPAGIPAQQPAEVEIGLYRWDAEHYGVDLRYTAPGQNGDVAPRQAGQVKFDSGGLMALSADPVGYGQLLGRCLFDDPGVRAGFAQCRTDAARYTAPDGKPWPLRVRLYLSPNAPELHSARWETLIDPADGVGLAAGEQIVFSRYLISPNWRPLPEAPSSPAALRVVLAVADPTDLAGYKPGGRSLPPVDVPAETARAREALPGLSITELSRVVGPVHRPTLENILSALREGCDILYLVCHGAIPRGEPLLWLEHDDGTADTVTGAEFVARVRDLRALPRLVVLASCQSGGVGGAAPTTTDAGALAGLGPRLAEAGVPAVLAMQGNVTMATVAQFMPVFFRELLADGQIDRAAAVARRACDRTRADWWAPALYHRLRNGNMWGTPTPPAPPFEPWNALLSNLRAGTCTPILGNGMLEPLMGTTREIARRWAETYRFPLAPHDRDDLPQVAQFLEVSQDRNFPRYELARYLSRALRRRFGAHPELAALPADAKFGEVLVAAGRALRTEPGAIEPHALLASLPFPVFITTNGDGLLADTLTRLPADKGGPKTPTVVTFDPDDEDTAATPPPTAQHPLICHLFGHFEDPLSVVLTEDDYFKYLINFAARRDRLPAVVKRKLVGSSLLFLGFRLEEWDFRVLLESIDAMQGSGKLRDYAQVAVQIDPEGGRFLDPASARRYLERHSRFTSASISIYWGKVADFLAELSRRWLAEQTGA
jgi:hypothetical protein